MVFRETPGLQLNARYVVRKLLGLMNQQAHIIAHNVWRMWHSNEI